MSSPFLGELRIFSFGFPPKGWAFCNGTLMSIQQNQALFALLGTVYGGNGTTTFGLPDLRGRAPVHIGTGFQQGQQGGEEAHLLTTGEIPAHTHQATASSNAGSQSDPGNAFWTNAGQTSFGTATNAAMAGNALGFVGGQPHNNMQPYLVLNFCIALVGIFPSRN
jgi:microcystin-dependent protein